MTEEKHLTGYPSIDKPWLKYYSEEAINGKLPECSIYEYMYENNSNIQKIISIPIESAMPVHLKVLLSVKNHRVNRQGIAWKTFIGAAKGSGIDHASHDLTNDLQDRSQSHDSSSRCDVAMIEYTGGSTGVPKGVMLTNKNLNSYYINFNMVNYCGVSSYEYKDKCLMSVPLFLAFGVSSCLHGPLCHGMELVMLANPDPYVSAKEIIRNRVNHVIGGRLMVEALVDMAQKGNADLTFVKSVMYGGEETNKAWEQSVRDKLKSYGFSAPVLNGYGMTETAAAILVAPDNDTDGLIPLANVNVKVIDPDDATVEYGYDTEGELCLSSDTIMKGYFKHEDENEKVLFEENGVMWIKTHDHATISPDGIIKMTGRIKRIYSKIASDNIQIRVYPMRIEETLIKHEAVHECAVIGVKDDVTAYRTVAYIIAENQPVDEDILRLQLDMYCHIELPDSHVPDEYIFVDAFPLTRAGKVDYRKLEEMSNGC